jgi:methionyl-tRNA formyltransferase
MKRHRALFLAGALPEAAAAMQGWLSAGHEIAAHWIGYSPRRGMMHRDARLARLAPRWSTKALTRQHAIPVREVPRLASWQERMDAVRATGADVLISAYFPFLVPPDMLDHFGSNAVNIHPAPLPRYRGPSPILAMYLDGSIVRDAVATLHQMSGDFDAGDVIATEAVGFPVDGDFTRLSLAIARAAHALTARALPAYLQGGIVAQPQDESGARYVRVLASDLTLRSEFDSRMVEWRCNTIARRRPVEVEGLPGVRIAGFGAVLGPPTGQPPHVGPLAVDLDVFDARVRLQRKRPWTSPGRKFHDLLVQTQETGGW